MCRVEADKGKTAKGQTRANPNKRQNTKRHTENIKKLNQLESTRDQETNIDNKKELEIGTKHIKTKQQTLRTK